MRLNEPFCHIHLGQTTPGPRSKQPSIAPIPYVETINNDCFYFFWVKTPKSLLDCKASTMEPLRLSPCHCSGVENCSSRVFCRSISRLSAILRTACRTEPAPVAREKSPLRGKRQAEGVRRAQPETTGPCSMERQKRKGPSVIGQPLWLGH